MTESGYVSILTYCERMKQTATMHDYDYESMGNDMRCAEPCKQNCPFNPRNPEEFSYQGCWEFAR